jgi:hypothetical protein
MSSDDRLRQAFDDLGQRTESVDPQYSLQRLSRSSTERRAWVPALAGAGAVLVVIGVVGVAGLLSGPETDEVVATTVPNTTTAIPDSTTTTLAEQVTTTTAVIPDERLAYPTHRVIGVADDDVLNVRAEPGAAADLVAVLPPNYAGIRAIESVAIVEDGGEWQEVELLDPTRVIDGGELDGQRLSGWVNAAFIEEYDPSLPDVFPCEHDLGPMPAPSGVAPDHVYSIRQFGLGGCIRTVVTFGADFDEGRWPIDGITTDMRPAGTPSIIRHQVNGTTVFVLEDVPYAWATQSGTFESSASMVGRWTDGSLAIFVSIPGTTSVRVAATGELVIDVTPFGTTQHAGNGFHILGEPVVGPGGTIEVWGLARPFEANIGTTLLDSTGGPPEVDAPPYVATTDWTEAWGLFQYRAHGLEPGQYLLSLVAEGGLESIEFSVPFEIGDRSPEDTVTEADLAVTDGLRSAARGDQIDLPFADEVTISLGADHEATLSNPSDGAGWTIDVEEWNGYAGPFDVLGPLRNEVGITTTSVGPQPHCAGPPLDIPWDAARQLTIQPAGISSCLEWYGISLFLNDAGEIERVMLDLWEP